MKVTFELPLRNPRPYDKTEEAGTVIEARPPRIACLLALAHRFQTLIDSGQVKDYAELARLGHVSRARLNQIMNLLFLAPNIQEQLLLWPALAAAAAPTERDMRKIVREVCWENQDFTLPATPNRLLKNIGNISG